MCVGKPVWDYWIPCHFTQLGYSFAFIGEPFFFHEVHPIKWTQEEWMEGGLWLMEKYGEKASQVPAIVPLPTEGSIKRVYSGFYCHPATYRKASWIAPAIVRQLEWCGSQRVDYDLVVSPMLKWSANCESPGLGPSGR